MGFEALATGHHARLRRDADGWHLLRGADPAKDQSYVLYMLGQGQLARVPFPVGEMTKEEVRRRARDLGLGTAEQAESQDLCFVGPEGYREFLRDQFPEAAQPGPIVDLAGREVGRHDGVAGFTVGQRRGLGVALGEPRYVVEIRPETATVVVGRARRPAGGRLPGGRGVLGGGTASRGGRPGGQGALPVPGRRRPGGAGARRGSGWSWFEEPQAAVTPGQAAVLYRGDEVLGGGTILEALSGLRPAQGRVSQTTRSLS